VPAAIKHGWLDGIFADLEKENYACGVVVLGAHSVGAPHIRQRLYWVAHSSSGRLKERSQSERELFEFGQDNRMGNPNGSRQPQHCGGVSVSQEFSSTKLRSNAWDFFDIIPCLDGKQRRIESGIRPLADGVSGRVGLLRGAGNAIVPQVAAVFIKSFMESIDGI
jgi:DNA (cytosine-5)-methyltransferase 1